MQWAIPHTRSEGSVFIQVMAFNFVVSTQINLKEFSLMVGMGKSVAGASDGVMSNTLKPLTKAQTVRGRPTLNGDNERRSANS